MMSESAMLGFIYKKYVNTGSKGIKDHAAFVVSEGTETLSESMTLKSNLK